MHHSQTSYILERQGMRKKEYILVNLGQFEDVTPLKQHITLMFLECINAKKSKKGIGCEHCTQ